MDSSTSDITSESANSPEHPEPSGKISDVESAAQDEAKSVSDNNDDQSSGSIERLEEGKNDHNITSESNKDTDVPEPKQEKQKNDGFLSPMSLPPTFKVTKKTESKQTAVSMSFKSKFAIPADIYKAPKAAAFMAEMMPRINKSSETEQREKDKQDVDPENLDPQKEKPKPKPPPAKLTYEAPEWSCEPEDKKYSFEVLKMGSIVDKVELFGKKYFLVGRLPDCDIKMEHPSISRYHAVLQYGAPGPDAYNVELQKDSSFGFYVFDLGSTHGTMINKQNIRSKTFYRIKVGHVIKFGGSTRLFILQGPVEDQEEEAKETATELRQYNKQKLKKKKDLEKMMLGEDSSSDEEDGDGKKRIQKSVESSGVTWGMLEDAVENSSDEEDDQEEEVGDTRADHPDAVLVHTKKDPFYVKDPMKALKNLYEKEKLELDFECDERRSGHWHVRLCLPVDGPNGKPVYAEVNATGKKKDTIKQCAIEACRTLERHGMFHRKDQQKQKVKQWEKDDFYDSDEDEYHDRTGDLNRKRTLRMQRIGRKLKTSKVVETYESLAKKVQELDDEIKDIESKLEKDREATKVNTDAVDPLDQFMQQVKSGKALDTTTRAKLKRRLFDARKEHLRVSKLAELARPSSLPPLVSSSTKSYSFIGKMKGKRKPITNIQSIPTREKTETSSLGQEFVEQEEEEEDEGVAKESSASKQTKIVKLMDIEKALKSTTQKPNGSISNKNVDKTPSERTENEISKIDKQNSDIDADQSVEIQNEKSEAPSAAISGEATHKRILGPTLPPEIKEQLDKVEGQSGDQDADDEETVEPKKKRRRQRKPRQVNDPTKPLYSNDPKYSVWLPPEDQSGDGKISLNEKLGY